MDIHRRGAWFAAGVIVAVVGGTITWAGAHGGDTGRIHGCVVPSSGYLRVIGANDTCKKSETAVDWTAQAVPATRMLSATFGSATAGPCGTAQAGSIELTLTSPTTLYVSASGSLRRVDGTSGAKGRLSVALIDPDLVNEDEQEDGVVAEVNGHPEDSVVLSDPNDTIGLGAAGVMRGGGTTFVAPPGAYTLALSMHVSGVCELGGGSGTHDLASSRLDVIATPTG